MCKPLNKAVVGLTLESFISQIYITLLQFSAIGHNHALQRLAIFRSDHLHLPKNIKALHHLAEDDMLAV